MRYTPDWIEGGSGGGGDDSSEYLIRANNHLLDLLCHEVIFVVNWMSTCRRLRHHHHQHHHHHHECCFFNERGTCASRELVRIQEIVDLKSALGNRLFWLKNTYVVGFLISSGKTTGWCLKLHHNHILPHFFECGSLFTTSPDMYLCWWQRENKVEYPGILSHVYWRTAAGVLEEFSPHIFRASAASEVADCIDPEMSINIYQPSRRHVPRDLHLHQHSCKTLKSLIMNHTYFSSLRFRFLLHQLCFPAIFILAFNIIMLLHIIIIIIPPLFHLLLALFHFLLRLQIHRQICFCIFLLWHFIRSVSTVLSIMLPIKCNNGINQKLPIWS